MNPYNLPQGIEPHFSRYIKFIESRPKRGLKKETEFHIHHILPKSMGGTSKDNLIKLTYREHYIAHLILWKCYNKGMSKAFHLMINSKNIINLTSKQYALNNKNIVLITPKRKNQNIKNTNISLIISHFWQKNSPKNSGLFF